MDKKTVVPENLTQYSVMTYMRKESKKVDTCITDSFAVQQKRTQHCKANYNKEIIILYTI